MSFLKIPKWIGCAALAAVSTVASALATGSAVRPDFTGTWKLNTVLSSFAPLPPYRGMTDRIEQSAAGLKIHRWVANYDHERTSDIEYKLDGIEVVAKHTTGESHTLARWDGAALVIESTLEFEGLPVRVRDRWSIAPNGMRLEVLRHFENQQGAIDQKLIFDKQ